MYTGGRKIKGPTCSEFAWFKIYKGKMTACITDRNRYTDTQTTKAGLKTKFVPDKFVSQPRLYYF